MATVGTVTGMHSASFRGAQEREPRNLDEMIFRIPGSALRDAPE
jgi:hypothetical protein